MNSFGKICKLIIDQVVLSRVCSILIIWIHDNTVSTDLKNAQMKKLGHGGGSIDSCSHGFERKFIQELTMVVIYMNDMIMYNK